MRSSTIPRSIQTKMTYPNFAVPGKYHSLYDVVHVTPCARTLDGSPSRSFREPGGICWFQSRQLMKADLNLLDTAAWYSDRWLTSRPGYLVFGLSTDSEVGGTLREVGQVGGTCLYDARCSCSASSPERWFCFHAGGAYSKLSR